MTGDQQRVVAAFDDPDEAEKVKHDLEQQGDVVDENADADAEVAFASTDERGDSAERPPDTTVAVEVDDAAAGPVADELGREGADDVEVRQPVEHDDAARSQRGPDEP